MSASGPPTAPVVSQGRRIGVYVALGPAMGAPGNFGRERTYPTKCDHHILELAIDAQNTRVEHAADEPNLLCHIIGSIAAGQFDNA